MSGLLKCFMGIDVGTSSVKTVLSDTGGRTVSSAQREYEIVRPEAGFAEQDMDEIWSAVKETILEAAAKGGEACGQIAGISYSGQMHGLVMVDKNGALIRNAVLWCDQRAKTQTEEVYRIIGEEAFKATALNSLSAGFLLSSLLWVREREPENYERIYKVMLPKDYIRYKMCGEIGTDYSDASASMAFDTGRNSWAWEMLEKLGIEKAFFPECHGGSEIAGEVTAECQRALGLQKGIPVTYGGGDSIMQQVGNGVISERSPWIVNIGTACSLNCVSDKVRYDSLYRLNVFSHLTPGRWMLMGANLSGGIVLKWLKNQVFFCGSYEEMTCEAAKAPPGSDGLILLPYFSGSRCPVPDPRASGIWAGLTLNHGREHMIRSAMEGIVYSMKAPFDIFEDLGLSTNRLIASGGGARGELFLQIEADIFDREIQKTAESEQSCLGASITAAVGTGHYADYEEACRAMVRYEDRIIEPNKENVKIYREGCQRYAELYPNNRTWFFRGNDRD